MGFNVQGIAISKKYDTAQKLADTIGLGSIEKVSDKDFEEASSSMIDDNDIYITVLKNGTLITLGIGFEMQEIAIDHASEEGKAILFMVGETSMAFAFEYSINGKSVRTVFSAEGQNMMEEGETLQIETKESDMKEIIFGLMEEIAGDSFYSIEPDHKSERYRQI